MIARVGPFNPLLPMEAFECPGFPTRGWTVVTHVDDPPVETAELCYSAADRLIIPTGSRGTPDNQDIDDPMRGSVTPDGAFRGIIKVLL